MSSVPATEQEATQENYGAQLSTARLRQGLTVQQVAEQLNLPVERIDEIESGEFDKLIGPTFYRGYIRSYAQLMKLNDSEILAGYNGALAENVELRSLGSVGIAGVSARREVNTRSSIFKWGTSVVVLVIVIAAIWGIKERFVDGKSNSGEVPTGEISTELFTESGNTASTKSPVATQSSEKPLAQTNSVAEPATKSATTPVESAPAAKVEKSEPVPSQTDQGVIETSRSVAPEKISAAESQATIATEMSSTPANLETLTFVFLGDCWVEVNDARGERLVIGLKKSGRVMSVDGVAPFSILLGDASAVQLKQGEEPIDLSGYRPGQTARLTLR